MSARFDSRELESLRYYLRAWSHRCRAWRPRELGHRSISTLVELMVPTVGWSSSADELTESDDREERVSSHVMTAIDAEVESLPSMLRAALKLVYMNEMGPDVFKHNRMSKAEAAHLCDRAERAMLPGLARRGVVL